MKMSPASGNLRRQGRKPLSVRIAHSGDRSRNTSRFGGHAGGGPRAVEEYRHRGLGIRQDPAGRSLKTAGSTCDLEGRGHVAIPCTRSMQSPPPVTTTFSRLPSWKRNMPPPATLGKKSPAQALDGCGSVAAALKYQNVNEPSVPIPATFSSTVFAPGCFR